MPRWDSNPQSEQARDRKALHLYTNAEQVVYALK